ncbi:TatD family hydrolase [Myroides sp. M-43]|uniref:TatD family hydrolase n=1 Tax=Myroides oncorhynchi TaxID=2893756 RepID=UPI001E54BAE3|nr:TatD family hydrolase [Myroides oncorhynchi]MCC9041471.1 TatD family hydrolase [Myroides oncorhynchi]
MKINIHTHHITNQHEIVEIINQYPMTVDNTLPTYSVGIHPWYIDEERLDEELTLLEEELQQPNCLAIGECGLDKKINISLNIQIDVFKRQLLLAEKYKKAVILHVVSAYQEVIAIKKELNITVPLIIHSFNKKRQVAESLWKNGFFLSFGKHLIYNEALRDTFVQVPREQIFLETDDVEEITIAEVYRIAEQLNEHIERQIEENYKRIFNR